MARNSLLCADVPLRNYSHSFWGGAQLPPQTHRSQRGGVWEGSCGGAGIAGTAGGAGTYASPNPTPWPTLDPPLGIMPAQNFFDVPHFSLVPPHEGAQRLFVTD